MWKAAIAIALVFSFACNSKPSDGAGGMPSAVGGTVSVETSINAQPPSGAYVMPLQVALSSKVVGGVVRYTLDGTEPTVESTLAVSSIALERTTELRAATFVNGVMSGAPSVFVYVSRTTEATSELPLMVIDDYGAGVPTKEVTNKAALLVIEPVAGSSNLASPATLASRAGIHLRGQTSAEFPQKGYKIELWDANDGDTDLPIATLPAESDFVLHNPYVDKSLIRNAFTYGLGAELGLMSPKFAFVELYFNSDDRPLSADDYQGVYLLVESIKNSKNRLDLDQLTAMDTTLPDITGGYILKFELDVAEEPTLSCRSTTSQGRCWVDLEVSDPKAINVDQRSYITDYIQSFNEALFGANFTDPNLGYAAYIDVDSFVNYFVLQEFTRNLDAYIRSMYFHKVRDGKLFMGPLWDYNLIGGIGCCGNDPIAGWQYAIARNGDANGWFQRLIEDPVFLSKVVTRYRELRNTVLSDVAIDRRILALTAPLGNAATRHFAQWPILSQAQLTYFTTSRSGTWQAQVADFSNWLHQRAAWLDTQW